MSIIIQPNQLKPGDVVLFVSGDDKKPADPKGVPRWYVRKSAVKRIRKETNSNYTHAAICYDSTTIVHAPSPSAPVMKTPIQELLACCKYAAVFRNPFAFGGDRVKKLQMFLDKVVWEGRPYNTEGVRALGVTALPRLDNSLV